MPRNDKADRAAIRVRAAYTAPRWGIVYWPMNVSEAFRRGYEAGVEDAKAELAAKQAKEAFDKNRANEANGFS